MKQGFFGMYAQPFWFRMVEILVGFANVGLAALFIFSFAGGGFIVMIIAILASDGGDGWKLVAGTLLAFATPFALGPLFNAVRLWKKSNRFIEPLIAYNAICAFFFAVLFAFFLWLRSESLKFFGIVMLLFLFYTLNVLLFIRRQRIVGSTGQKQA